MSDAGSQIRGNTAGDALLIRTILVKLVAFEAEMTYSLDSPTEQVTQLGACIMHLQRLIVADNEYREKWQAAFTAHETHCERLGAVHLLWHGIWAFKVDAAGGRTDIVYQEPLSTGTTPIALGMVLTEWKRADGGAEAAYGAARRQAAGYTSGILAGVELASHRYVVVVTKQRLSHQPDIIEAEITYRHINIAVEPASPSIAARASEVAAGRKPLQRDHLAARFRRLPRVEDRLDDVRRQQKQAQKLTDLRSHSHLGPAPSPPTSRAHGCQ